MPRRGRRVPMGRGISRDASGFSVRLQVAGVEVERRFPLATPIAKMRRWREDEIARRRALWEAGRPLTGTFAADAATYLAAVQAMPSYASRQQEIGVWVAHFGERPRDTIQPVEIRTLRDRWLTVGPKLVQQRIRGERVWVPVPGPLSASSVNKRLRALSNLYRVLDGRHVRNVVREIPEAIEDERPPRDLPWSAVERLLDALPPSQTQCRLRVIAWTGLAHTQLAALTPADVHLDAGTMFVRRRRKGRCLQTGRLVPLLPQAIDAFRAFAAADCWGTFSASSMWTTFQRAAAKVGLQGVRPYDLRHTFSTIVVLATGGDERLAQEMLGHVDIRTTRHYTRGALSAQTAAAFERLKSRMAPAPHSPNTPEAGRVLTFTADSDASPERDAQAS